MDTQTFDINEYEVSSGTVKNLDTYSISATWTEQVVGTKIFAYASTPTTIAIDFGGVSTATYVRLSTDKTVEVYINAGSTAINMSSDMILTGATTSIGIKNISSTDATVYYEIKG